MTELERALRELEIATAELAGISVEDADAACAILNRRSKAIARLAGLIHSSPTLSHEARDRILESLRSASDQGELAGEKLARAKRKTMVEWSRWNQIHLALDGASPATTKIDYRG
jgi:hypothetical protein